MDPAKIEKELKRTIKILVIRAGSNTEAALGLQEILRLDRRTAKNLVDSDFSNILTKKLKAWNRQLEHVLELK